MTILRETQSWTRPKRPWGFRLTLREQANVKKAMHGLRRRFGTWALLAKAMRANRRTLENLASRIGLPTGSLAIRVARIASVPIEDVLAGAYPDPEGCPHCGRGYYPNRTE